MKLEAAAARMSLSTGSERTKDGEPLTQTTVVLKAHLETTTSGSDVLQANTEHTAVHLRASSSAAGTAQQQNRRDESAAVTVEQIMPLKKKKIKKKKKKTNSQKEYSHSSATSSSHIADLVGIAHAHADYAACRDAEIAYLLHRQLCDNATAAKTEKKK